MFLSLNSEIFFSIQMSQCQSQFDVTRWLYSRSSQQWQRIEWLMFFFSAETSHHNWKLSSIPPLSNRNHCRNISCLKNPRGANFSKWTWRILSHHHHVFLGWLFVGNCSLCLKIVWSKTLASQKMRSIGVPNKVWCPEVIRGRLLVNKLTVSIFYLDCCFFSAQSFHQKGQR